MIRKTAGKYPQESYAAVARAIQSEWIFLQLVTKNTVDVLQYVTKNTGDEFVGVDKMFQETFLPRLFFGKSKLSLSL